MFEQVIEDQINNQIEKKIIFNENHHGFRQNCSCLSQLLSHYDCTIQMAEKNSHTVGVKNLAHPHPFCAEKKALQTIRPMAIKYHIQNAKIHKPQKGAKCKQLTMKLIHFLS